MQTAVLYWLSVADIWCAGRLEVGNRGTDGRMCIRSLSSMMGIQGIIVIRCEVCVETVKEGGKISVLVSAVSCSAAWTTTAKQGIGNQSDVPL